MSLFILCGVPGSGKTTVTDAMFKHELKTNHRTCIITRDDVRVRILNGPKCPYLPKDKMSLPVDMLCNASIISSLENEYRAIYDGCNTSIYRLNLLLEMIRHVHFHIPIVLIMLGDDETETKHKVVDVDATLFSEYERDEEGNLLPNHSAIPRSVMEEKRKEMKELIALIDPSVPDHIQIGDFKLKLIRLTSCPSENDLISKVFPLLK